MRKCGILSTLLNIYMLTAKRAGMSSTSPETHIGEFVADLAYSDLPNRVTETIIRAFIDTVGVTLAGTVEGAGRKAVESTDVNPNTADVATLLGVSGTSTLRLQCYELALLVMPSITTTFHGQ